MPAHVHLDPSATVALVVLEGTVRWGHLASALLGLYGREDSNPELAVLWDARAVSGLDLPPGKVPALVALLDWLQGAYDGGRTAVVVRREIDGIIARYLIRSRRQRGREYGVFYRMEEALAFLGLPSAEALPAESDRVLAVG